MSNLSSVINDNQANLKGAVFHYKFFAIVLFISSGFLILGGVFLFVTIIGILAALIYFAIAGLYIYLGLRLIKASNSAKNIINVSELTQDDYNTNSINIINETKTYLKVNNILSMISLGFVTLILVGSLAFLPMIFSEIGKATKDIPSLSNPTLNSNYQPNPTNKTAAEMGMTDAEHEMMHDPKNIFSTDYSQLDYSQDQINAAQDSVKNAMEAMTPEQKSAMEKMMGELKK